MGSEGDHCGTPGQRQVQKMKLKADDFSDYWLGMMPVLRQTFLHLECHG
jgi:hypothetical protein